MAEPSLVPRPPQAFNRGFGLYKRVFKSEAVIKSLERLGDEARQNQ